MTKALIVDDDAAIRSLVSALLIMEGYAVDQAADGLQAIQKLRSRRRPDVVLLDLVMPAMDGWRFLDASRAIKGCEDLPVVVLSASHFAPRDQRVRAFVSKPFDLDVLAGTVRKVAPP